MTDRMSGAEVAATRSLLGLSQQDLAGILGVRRDTVRDWERDRFGIGPGPATDLASLRARHDRETRVARQAAADGITAELAADPMPRGWYVAVGARVLDTHPDAQLSWAIDDD